MTMAVGFVGSLAWGLAVACTVLCLRYKQLAKQKAADMRLMLDRTQDAQPGTAEKTGFLDTFAEPLKDTKWGAKLAADYEKSGQKSSFSKYVLSMIIFAALAYFLGASFGGSQALGLLLLPIGLATPVLITRSRLGNRQAELRKQMPEVLALLVSSLRAGNSLSQAFADAADQLPAPAAGLFSLILRNEQLGLSTEQAIAGVSEASGSEEFQLVSQAILALKQSGGNLAEILENISVIVRERAKLMSQVRNATTQQRMSAHIVGAIPLVIAVGMVAQNPAYFAPLLAKSWGVWLLLLALAMNVSGYLLAMKLAKVRV